MTHDETSNDKKDRDKKRMRKDGKDRNKVEKVKGRKKPVGPMHFTANNEPRALDVLGDLDPSVFEEVNKFSIYLILLFSMLPQINQYNFYVAVQRKNETREESSKNSRQPRPDFIRKRTSDANARLSVADWEPNRHLLRGIPRSREKDRMEEQSLVFCVKVHQL